MRQNQRLAYSALFKASSDAIKKLALDQKHIGADLPGFFGVLTLGDEPCSIIPISTTSFRVALCVHPMAPGIPPESISFSPSKRSLKIFRAKFRDLMKQAELFDQIPAEVWHIDWNVNCQAVSLQRS